jgi:hypothetical protein
MGDNVLQSMEDYSGFLASLLTRPTIERCTVSVWSVSPYTGIAEGEVHFRNGVRLRMREEIDFEAGLIASYGYEAYRHGERLFWYDDFPHPKDPSLASTFSHHKHVAPDIKHNRIPAPSMSFTQPNLPAVVAEIEELS